MISVANTKSTFYRTVENSGPSSLFLILLLNSFVFFQLAACTDQAQEHVFSGSIMGTYYRVVVVDEKPISMELGEGALQVMENINQQMSTYIPDSELNDFNRHEAQVWFPLSEQLSTVVAQAMEISALSDGAFDITVAPLVDAWGFGANKDANKTASEINETGKAPDQLSINEMDEYVGYQQLQLQENRLLKFDARTSIDLSAIAKGYAVEQVAAYLKQQGYDHFLIDIGGELKASGESKLGEVWRVAIERPYVQGGIARVVTLNDKAIATSGDYRNYIMVDGKQYSHVLDPKTMKPKQHRLASVTVIADSATVADGLATAILVMGEQAGWEFAVKHQHPVLFMIRDETVAGEPQMQIRFTAEFQPFLLQ